MHLVNSLVQTTILIAVTESIFHIIVLSEYLKDKNYSVAYSYYAVMSKSGSFCISAFLGRDGE